MNLWDRIEESRSKWNVLQHPFYQRWSAGELTLEELADYSGQYRYATEAVAAMSAGVAEVAPEAEPDGGEAPETLTDAGALAAPRDADEETAEPSAP